jgi:hypothetical protein
MRRSMQQGRTPVAGGIFLFLGPVVGAIYGINRGEPILWMLYGFVTGVALAIMVWLIDRRRR